MARDEPLEARWIEGQVRVVSDGRQVRLTELASGQRLMIFFSVEQERIIQVVIIERTDSQESGALPIFQRDARNLTDGLKDIRRDVDAVRRALDI